jgi:Rap1 Myb domain
MGIKYSPEEDEAILSYLCSRKSVNALTGDKLWKEAEDAKICDGRTWQSMKGHFKTFLNTRYANLPQQVGARKYEFRSIPVESPSSSGPKEGPKRTELCAKAVKTLQEKHKVPCFCCGVIYIYIYIYIYTYIQQYHTEMYSLNIYMYAFNICLRQVSTAVALHACLRSSGIVKFAGAEIACFTGAKVQILTLATRL